MDNVYQEIASQLGVSSDFNILSYRLPDRARGRKVDIDGEAAMSFIALLRLVRAAKTPLDFSTAQELAEEYLSYYDHQQQESGAS